MWLINVESFELHEFVDDPVPDYSILSHTWTDHEITFQQMKDESARGSKGYDKIVNTCQLSRGACDWVWIDTCCIDKDSSAQLSEAINSETLPMLEADFADHDIGMYRYYANAATCYVYLSDLVFDEGLPSLEALEKCRWFKRSWTLQELLAPKVVFFYDREWNFRGTRDELVDVLGGITRIDEHALLGPPDFSNFSVAKKMSWAADRQATRKEDVAYSLLGLFNVNMPLLYGEGSKAFIRLQEEIMKQSDDQSLFAWGTQWHFLRQVNTHFKLRHARGDFIAEEDFNDSVLSDVGFLATSPEDFRESADVVSYATEQDEIWTTTNKGIQVNFPTISFPTCSIFLLNCYLSSDLNFRLAVVSALRSGAQRTRASRGLWLIHHDFEYDNSLHQDSQRFFWAKDTVYSRLSSVRENGILVKAQTGMLLFDATPREAWDEKHQMFIRGTHKDVLGGRDSKSKLAKSVGSHIQRRNSLLPSVLVAPGRNVL